MTTTPPPEYDPNDLCDDEEVFACGDGGTEDDQNFDALIGVIEDFMCNFSVMGLLVDSVPSLASVPDDHDRHLRHKAFVALIEAKLDEHVEEKLPGMHVPAVAAMIKDRMNEVSEEVWDFVNHGCMDYVSFLALWRENKP